MQMSDLEKIINWLSPLWQMDSMLYICVMLSLLFLAWFFCERYGLLIGESPAVKALTVALQTSDITILGSKRVSVGDELKLRLGALASETNAMDGGITLVQRLLAEFYDKQPFGTRSFEKALNYAVIYTLAFLVLPWQMGEAGVIGQTILLPPDLTLTQRMIVLLPSIPIAVYRWVIKRYRWKGYGWRGLFSRFLSFLAPGAVSFWASFSIFDIGAGVGTVSIICAVAVAVTGTTSVAAPVAVAGAGSIIFAGAGIDSGAVAFTAFTAVSFAIIFTFILDEIYKPSPEDKIVIASPYPAHILGCAWLWITLFFYLSFYSCLPTWPVADILVQTDKLKGNKLSFSLLFFLGWLPVINALFDYLSVGLTQYFLERIRQRRWSVWWWLADAASAVMLVFGLYGQYSFYCSDCKRSAGIWMRVVYCNNLSLTLNLRCGCCCWL